MAKAKETLTAKSDANARTGRVSFRTTGEFRRLLQACADAEHRSVSNYIIWVVRADAARRGIKGEG